ncbi:MAG: YbaY family lipoprotein, partial [Gammaproteobacteria bacterium]
MKFVHILLIAAVASCLISCAAPARLDEAGRTIAGTVTYRARIALPSGSEVVVEARDGNGKVLAEKTLPTQGRQPPFQYTLQIPADVTATLRAGIRVGGQPRWASEPIEIAAGSEPNDGIEIVVQPVRPVGFASRLRCGETDVTLGAEGQNAVLEVGGERFELAPVQSASGRRYQASGDPQTFVQLEGSRSQVSIRGKMLPECSDLKTPPENGTAIPDTYGSSGARRATDERVDDEQAGMAGIGDLPSSYEGELSCQGCEAIRYQLNLLPDHRYVLRASYRGTGHQSDSSGIWRFLADGTELL